MYDLTAVLWAISLPSILALWWLLARVHVEPRRPVPWNGLDVLVVLGAYVLLLWTLLFTTYWGLGIPLDIGKDQAAVAGKNHEDPSANEKTAMHPLLVALGRRHHPGTLLLCGFAAVLVAPLAEEFLFRLLLQGWLEAAEGHWRKRIRPLRWLMRGLSPVLLASLLFAAGHIRGAEEPGNVDHLLTPLMIDGLARLLAVAFAVGYLRFRTGATAADLGFIPKKLPRDLALGLAAIACCMPLLISVQWAAGAILAAFHKTFAADPVTLFFFAAVLGIIYFRTHRIAPSIVMHVAFNAMMLTAAWYLPKP